MECYTVLCIVLGNHWRHQLHLCCLSLTAVSQLPVESLQFRPWYLTCMHLFMCVFLNKCLCGASVLKCDYFLVLMMKEAIFSHISLCFESLYALNCSDPSVRASFVSSHHLVQTLAAFASSTTLKAMDVWDASVEKSARELWNTINQVETFQHLFCHHRSTQCRVSVTMSSA